MGEYKHGEMDVTGNQRVFEGFLKWVVWVAGVSIGVLIFLAIFNS
jgi:Bacterial aa3 type cytochrome c oxidase subunit IV